MQYSILLTTEFIKFDSKQQKEYSTFGDSLECRQPQTQQTDIQGWETYTKYINEV